MREKVEEIYQMCGKYVVDNDWNELMEVVEFIENIDHKNLYYEWEDFDEAGNKQTHYNFNGYSVDIESNQCFIFLSLKLDPGKTICNSVTKTKFESVLNACYEFAKLYNENKL